MQKPDIDIVSFKAIANFVKELGAMFEKKHRPLKLYRKLIQRTQIGHDKAIKKHLSIFTNFCTENRDSILSQNVSELKIKNIIYTPRKVFINVPLVFSFADNESKKIIWQHILYISSRLDPLGNAKDMLKKSIVQTDSDNETNFIDSLITKVEDMDLETDNPMEAVNSMMSSGVFAELMGSMQEDMASGKLDISKLMGSVHGMIGQLNQEAGNNPELASQMSAMNGMLGMMTNMGNLENSSPIIEEEPVEPVELDIKDERKN